MNLPLDDDLDVRHGSENTEDTADHMQSLANKLKEAREIAIKTT